MQLLYHHYAGHSSQDEADAPTNELYQTNRDKDLIHSKSFDILQELLGLTPGDSFHKPGE